MTRVQLTEQDLDKSPFHQFSRWFEEARAAQPEYVDAMTVSTCGSDGIVSSRIALLKHFDEHGFVFFTNYNSRKGTQLSENPRISLCFFWPALERSVRIEGVAVKTTTEESDAYFATRPRGSQLGAWASRQSAPLASRGELEARIRETEQRFAGRDVPRPPFWSGFRVVPAEIEFWYGQPSRLHERDVYTRDASMPGGWRIRRLYP